MSILALKVARLIIYFLLKKLTNTFDLFNQPPTHTPFSWASSELKKNSFFKKKNSFLIIW